MTQALRETLDISSGGKIVVGLHGQIDIAGGALTQDGVPLTDPTLGVTADEKAALDAAASPSDVNAFATIADVPAIPVADNVAALAGDADLPTTVTAVNAILTALKAAGLMTADA